MGLPEAPSPPHLYPQSLQLKLYQAFIFSIPILFSIILFLLFYLFYLKKRNSNVSSAAPTVPRSTDQAAYAIPSNETGMKEFLVGKLPVILFDEDSKTDDSQCCVCLGEFEVNEKLHQLPSCKHIFHTDCIRHWLQSNSTCPLCRRSVIINTQKSHQPPAIGHNMVSLDNEHLDQSPQNACAERQEQSGLGYFATEQDTTEGSSGASTSVCIDNQTDNDSHSDPSVLRIQIDDP